MCREIPVLDQRKIYLNLFSITIKIISILIHSTTFQKPLMSKDLKTPNSSVFLNNIKASQGKFGSLSPVKIRIGVTE
jgi:hypothetical protein